MYKTNATWDLEAAFKINDFMGQEDWSVTDWDEAERNSGDLPLDWSNVRINQAEKQERQRAVRLGGGIVTVYQSRSGEAAKDIRTTITLLTRDEKGKPKFSSAFGTMGLKGVDITSTPEDRTLIEGFLDAVAEDKSV